MRHAISDRADKSIDDRLRVHLWTPQGFVSPGVLDLQEDGGEMSASFAYDPAYLSSAGAVPLDPINLPLTATRFATQSAHVRLGAIFDAAPDAWGRKVVTAQMPEQVRQRVFRHAFLRGADGIGALILTPESLTQEIDLDRIVAASLRERPGLSQLAQAARAAHHLEAGLAAEEITEEMRHMLGGSWTIGGARPKAILRDDRPGAVPGLSLIAKFGSRHDTLARNRLEYASLRMARDMGFRVPDHFLVESDRLSLADSHAQMLQGPPPTDATLVLERFDREVLHLTADSGSSSGSLPESGALQVGRRHYLSALSLASYQPQSKFLDTAMDRATLSWSRLLDLSSRICESPNTARVEMFARLCLNAALRNTDDHLKNFGFLRVHGSAMRMEIAPVFDVSPQAGQRHYLHCASLGQVYTLHDAITQARALGVSKAAAAEVEERIVGVLANRQDYWLDAGMNPAEIERVEAWVLDGLGPRYVQRLQDARSEACAAELEGVSGGDRP